MEPPPSPIGTNPPCQVLSSSESALEIQHASTCWAIPERAVTNPPPPLRWGWRIPFSSLWKDTGPWLDAMISWRLESNSSQEVQNSASLDKLISSLEVSIKFHLFRYALL